MAKFRYFHWEHPYKGCYEGKTLIYIEAENKEEAREKLEIFGEDYPEFLGFIVGDIKEVKEFIQPKQIKIIN